MRTLVFRLTSVLSIAGITECPLSKSKKSVLFSDGDQSAIVSVLVDEELFISLDVYDSSFENVNLVLPGTAWNIVCD